MKERRIPALKPVDANESGSNENSGNAETTSNPTTMCAQQEYHQNFPAEVAAHPELLLKRCENVTLKFRNVMREIYDRQSVAVFGKDALKFQFAPKAKSNSDARLGPLMRLETGQSFDCEQLWEELEMRNDPFCRHIQRTVNAHKAAFEHAKNAANGQQLVPDLQNTKLNIENADDSDDEEQTTTKKRPVGILKPEKLEEHQDMSDAKDASGSEHERKTPAKVCFLEEQVQGVENSSAEEAPGVKPDALEDGFFSLADMEAFADEAESLALNGRLVASKDESDSDDEEDERNNFARNKASGTSDGRTMRYNEFFAPPMSGKVKEETAKALRRANLFDEGSEGEDSADDGEKEEQTPLQRSRAAIRQTMDAMEDAAVAKKPWQLRGEVLGDSRPKNSVLDANFEHDIAFHNRAFSAPESAESIEDLIRQRIHDRLFDDVVRTLPPEYEEAKRGKKDIPEVSQEKPTEGLGELYAREFAEQREQISKNAEAAGIVTKEEGPEETEEQAEVNRLYSRLCVKLDAMTSLHFTPSMPKVPEEMSVKPNVPALAAEEAIPEAVSDAALLAPNEVHNAKKEKALGELEKTKSDRRRSRRAVKKRLSSLNKERTIVQKHKELADPVLAEKRRAERALERRGKKLKTGNKAEKPAAVKANKTGDFSKSNRFFSNLQESIANDLAAAKAKPVQVSTERSAALYKL